MEMKRFTILLLIASAVEMLDCDGAGAINRQLPASSSSRPPRRKLFVFGDSYVDTGNLPKIFSPSWSQPYGVTFPGKPAGRFSDGRVFTDYLASFLGIKSPIPYKYRRYGHKLLPFGMNFAAGGSGVFSDTSILDDNLTVQIDNFRDQIDRGVIRDLQSSVALVAVSGNDYLYYTNNGGDFEGLKNFTEKVIEGLKLDLKRLSGGKDGDGGIPKVAVTNLHPIGCTPIFTSPTSYQRCNTTVNLAVEYHNELLQKAVDELNAAGRSSFVVIDLFRGFTSVLEGKKVGDLRPCCEGAVGNYRCGSVDLDGEKKYTVCPEPWSAFYWDTAHPTQAGWNAVFSSLNNTSALSNLLVS